MFMQHEMMTLNPRAGWMGWWPGWRAVLDPENGRIRSFLEEQAGQLAGGARLLDASAGSRPYQLIFTRQVYESCDILNSFYRCKHDFECFLDAIPRPDGHYDAVVLTQVLEHVPDPESVLRELARVTRSGGKEELRNNFPILKMKKCAPIIAYHREIGKLFRRRS
jgi:SAM-dependent methyltransferase